jgi:hypothetical protein
MKNAECRMQNEGARCVRGGLCLLTFSILNSAFCLCAQAQYSMDWSTVDGGGGTSTGGMSGGNYTLAGGFWGVIAIQTPGAPWLTITRTATNTVCVSWPLPAEGWVLEWTNRVAGVSAPWPQVSPPYQTNSGQAWIVEPAPTGNRYYRLHKP